MDEYAAALDEVAAIAVDREVDAVLVAGDIFDSPAPQPEAEKLVYDFLARLVKEQIPAVLIAGNHDHPRKLAALASLLEGLSIHVRHAVRPAGEGGVVSLRSRDGREEGRVAVLPFVPERKVGDACSVMDPERTWYESYAECLEQIFSALVADLTPSTVNLAIGHLLVAGSLFGTGERKLHLGDIYGLSPEQLPSSLQYIGLGHLHRPQEVMAPSKTLYSGSLIELDFGEKEQEKRVVIVEARPGQAAAVESVPLTAGRRLRDVEGTFEELQAMADELGDAFLRVTVKTAAPMPGLAEQVKELLPNALDVTVDYPRERTGRARPDDERPRTQLEPGELFAALLRVEERTRRRRRSSRSSSDNLHEEARAVRPVRLDVEGFTSFREKQSIDFSDLDLFAITGPTGAGKSSLIDALVFALYGQVPRVGDDYKQLISHGAERLNVLLEFEVGKERYRIARTARPAGASKQRLERIEDGEAHPLADRARDIRARIETLLGLDYDGFTRSVVLPQGQFDAFLKGEPKERRKILVSLLNLGRLRRDPEARQPAQRRCPEGVGVHRRAARAGLRRRDRGDPRRPPEGADGGRGRGRAAREGPGRARRGAVAGAADSCRPARGRRSSTGTLPWRRRSGTPPPRRWPAATTRARRSSSS